MGLGDVHQEKLNFVLVRHVQVFHGPGLGPKRRSGITAEDKTDRFFAAKRRKADQFTADYSNALTVCAGLELERRQFEIRCKLPNLESRLIVSLLRPFAFFLLGRNPFKCDVFFAQFQRPAFAGILAPASRRGYPGPWPGLTARQIPVSGQELVDQEGCLLMPGRTIKKSVWLASSRIQLNLISQFFR